MKKLFSLLLLLSLIAACQPSPEVSSSAEDETSDARRGTGPLGQTPVVNAGSDESIEDTDNNGSQLVLLKGSAVDAQKNIKTYRLLVNNQLKATGSAATILTRSLTLNVGIHSILMEAIDTTGFKGSDVVIITVTKPTTLNTAPKVNAGPDFTVVDTDNDGSQEFKLQGSATDAENNITNYHVSSNGSTYAGGTVPYIFIQNISLPVGTHTVMLEATDAFGLKGSDTVVITVARPAVTNTAPKVNAGPDFTVVDTDNDGSQEFKLQGSATDAENNITNYLVSSNGSTYAGGTVPYIFIQNISLPVGTHTVILEATDALGLKGSDSFVVTVTRPAAPPVVVPPPPTGGTGPVANAGPDILQENTEYSLGVLRLIINGSATAGSDPIVSYVWKINNVAVHKGTTAASLLDQKFNFIKGNNLLSLEVTDSVGRKSEDFAIVEVKPSLQDHGMYGRIVIPGVMSVSAGGQRIILDRDGDGVESVRMVGSVNSKYPVASYTWVRRGVVLATGSNVSVLTQNLSLPLGVNNLRLEVVDTEGNTTRDEVSIDVSGFVIEQIPRIASNFNTEDFLGGEWDTGPAHWKDNSAFRFNCKASHFLFDDPIVFPKQPGKAHLHMFFGNTMANGNSTYDSLRTSGQGSCDGGPLNRSAYWMPAVMNENGKVVVPDFLTIYYKRHPGTNRLPRGLRMIFGYDHKQTDPAKQHHGMWKCSSGGDKHLTFPEVSCPATINGNHQIMAEISTPQCWDGKNLDSADHRSHMAFSAYNGHGEAVCPETHPVLLPAFSMIVAFSHTGHAEYSKWRLSSDHASPHDTTSAALPAGSSLHSDWFGAWDDNVMDMWHEGCMDQFKSCSGGALGMGKQLMRDPNFSWSTPDRIIDPPAKPILP